MVLVNNTVRCGLGKINTELERLREEWKGRKILVVDKENEHAGEMGEVVEFIIKNSVCVMIVKGTHSYFAIDNLLSIKVLS